MKINVVLFLAVCLVCAFSRCGLAQDYDDSQNTEDSNKPYSEGKPYGEGESYNEGKPYGEGSHASVEVPPGMELVNIGGIRMIIPQGTKVEKKGSLLVMEGVDEFVARNLKEMMAQLEKMEASQKDVRKMVDDLKQEVSDLRKK